jgi:hypothetical protein
MNCNPLQETICFGVVVGSQLQGRKGSQKPQIDEGQTIQWQMKKDKRTNNDLQNDRATRTPLKPMMNSWALDEFISSCSTRDTRRVIVKRHEHHLMTFRIIM